MAIQTDLTDGRTNAVAIFDAIMAAYGKSKTTEEMNRLFRKLTKHFGEDPQALTPDQIGSVVVSSVWTDFSDRARGRARRDDLDAAPTTEFDQTESDLA